MKKLRKRVLSLLLSVGLLSSTVILPGQSAAAAEDKENLALGKTVTVSAGGDEELAQKITDGAIARGWENSYLFRTAAEAEDENEKAYITIDLGESQEISQIKYIGAVPADDGYTNTSHHMVFRVSNDPEFLDESTQTVYNTDSANFFGFGAGEDTEKENSLEGILIDFEPVTARYVRYYHDM